MSNPIEWRKKRRTAKPNSRQKRNGLYLDKHADCQRCQRKPAAEAHHTLPAGHPARYEWQHMQALCISCHVEGHQQAPTMIVVVVR